MAGAVGVGVVSSTAGGVVVSYGESPSVAVDEVVGVLAELAVPLVAAWPAHPPRISTAATMAMARFIGVPPTFDGSGSVPDGHVADRLVRRRERRRLVRLQVDESVAL